MMGLGKGVGNNKNYINKHDESTVHGQHQTFSLLPIFYRDANPVNYKGNLKCVVQFA